MASTHHRHSPAPALAPFAVVALLVACIVLLAPATGSWQGDLRDVRLNPAQQDESPPPPQEYHDLGPEDRLEHPLAAESPTSLSPIWGQIASGLAGLLIATAVGVLVWWLVRYVRSRPPEEDVQALQVNAEIAPEEQIPTMAAAAKRAGRELHLAGEPADAIIRAWLTLEDAAAQTGLRRRPSDTPTDLTVLVLARTRADPAAARGLLRLYHRARFGTEPMTPTDQQRALDHLKTLADSWGAVNPDGAGLEAAAASEESR